MKLCSRSVSRSDARLFDVAVRSAQHCGNLASHQTGGSLIFFVIINRQNVGACIYKRGWFYFVGTASCGKFPWVVLFSKKFFDRLAQLMDDYFLGMLVTFLTLEALRPPTNIKNRTSLNCLFFLMKISF